MTDPAINPQLRALLGPPAPASELTPSQIGGSSWLPQDGKSFADTLKASLAEVNRLQGEADVAVEKLVTGEKPDIHGAMLALQKADLSFQVMMQVRNKILAAYRELSRMS